MKESVTDDWVHENCPRRIIVMWNGKKKAVTFSYDDGVTQDRRLVEMMNTYGVKGTFNLNSGM